jgi:hypothetical protein
MKRNTYPPEFIAALLDTAERAKIEDRDAPKVMRRLAELIRETPSPTGMQEMMTLVPKLCWLISEAGGWFYGSGAQY